MDIGEHELMLHKMKSKVDDKYKYLQKRFQIIEQNKDNDIYTKEIYNQYKKHFDNINNIKERQIKEFRNIHKHLDKLSKQISFNSSLLKELNHDKTIILNEINKLN